MAIPKQRVSLIQQLSNQPKAFGHINASLPIQSGNRSSSIKSTPRKSFMPQSILLKPKPRDDWKPRKEEKPQINLQEIEKDIKEKLQFQHDEDLINIKGQHAQVLQEKDEEYAELKRRFVKREVSYRVEIQDLKDEHAK